MTTEPTPATNITATLAATLTPMSAAPEASVVPSTAQPSRWPLRADLTLLVFLLVLSFFVASFTAANSDLWLNLAIGKRISAGKFEFGVDPYSVATEATETRPAVFWVHQAWLFSWLIYQVYNLVGGAGLILGKAVLFTVSIGLLCRVGWNEANRWFILICLVMAALAVSHRLQMQPIIITVLFLSVTLFLLDRARVFTLAQHLAQHPRGSEYLTAGLARSLWWLPPIFALWANLDPWFILGPIVLALCWAATGLAKWFPNGNPVPGKTIGAVLGASLLACLLNPFHVRVFQLPPELAYIVLSFTDPLSIPLPDALVAGGRTLKELAKADPNFSWTLSSVSSQYWQDPRVGMNVAGIAFYPLLILGLLSFTLVALVKPQPNAPTLHVSRFLLWLVFGVMALAVARMIPFFVLIAAPLTAMTLGEFLLWQQTSNAIATERRDRGLHMARFASIPFLLLLLFLAWPGWLHGTFEFHSPRRVAWAIRPDPSAVRVAEILHALHEKQQCGNVFNGNLELAGYLPWFAPDIKYFIDSRFSLYAGQAPAYHKVRLALVDPALPAADWQGIFKERKIGQIVMVNAGSRDYVQNLMHWWMKADQWRQRFADSRMLLLSWAGWAEEGKSWPDDTAEADWNRQAFGEVAADKRPPAHGFGPPEMPNFWTLYLEGVGPRPVSFGEYNLQQTYYMLKKQLQPFHCLPQPAPTCSFMMHCATLANLQALPGGGMTIGPAFAVLANQWKPLDQGPPALPILMVRTARQAIAENPNDVDGHGALMNANETLRTQQEDHWIMYQRHPRNPHPALLRDRVRQIQLVTTAYNLVQLQPDYPEHHLRLAQLYIQQDLLDLALEHMQLAEKGFEVRLATAKDAPKDPKAREAALRRFHIQHVEGLERTVRLREKQFKDNSGGRTLLQKADLALRESFKEVREGGGVDESRLGLGKKSLALLEAIDQKALKPEEEPNYLAMRFSLMISMGQADFVATALKREDIRNAMPPPLYSQFQLFAAGATGDYGAMEQALASREKPMRDGLKELDKEVNARHHKSIPSIVLILTQPTWASLSAVGANTYPELVRLNEGLGQRGLLRNEFFNGMTLRGIVALEAGNTKEARAFFKATLDEAGEHFYSESFIARRYFDLLNEQK